MYTFIYIYIHICIYIELSRKMYLNFPKYEQYLGFLLDILTS